MLLMLHVRTCIHISQGRYTALYLAAQEGHDDVVELLLKANADPELKKVIDLRRNECTTGYIKQAVCID